VSRKRRYDLREFWPWYERSVPLPPGAGHATPPPFTLSEIGAKEPRARRTAKPTLRVLWLVVGVALLALVLWAFLHVPSG
jgi:hypothetical protein